MTDYQNLSAAALHFVNLLTPGHFVSAQEWISPDCEYFYGDIVLKGKAILHSFITNHDNAAQKLDRIEYLDGKIENIEGQTVSVLVTDRVHVGNRIHDYQDRLIVTFKRHADPGSVIRIENRRVDGEREKLLQFFEACGVEWN